MKRGLTLAVVWIAAWASAGAASVDYARDILPILSDKCYHCHGPDEKARKAKLRLDVKEIALRTKEPVIVPGKSGESELVSRITTTNLDDQMPPPESNRTLTPKQIELLTRWIDEGAKWGQHWAFVPPVRPAVPVISKSVISETARKAPDRRPNTDSLITDYLIGNPIDAFVAARLQKQGLRQAPETTREGWLRRVTFDLTGLPPTLKEIDEFMTDASTNAHETVVDRLLASPRFGERMATEWLDLARFADTHGYQMDRFRPVWPYRDWVIKAFNENLPFDQFVTWQLAGDLLPNATKEQRLATAFNRLHNQNEEGGVVEEEYRVAYVVDRVNTFGTAFLGLTTECSRCHDHKYDPFTQRDFYSLFAFFQNIDESGQTSYFTDSAPVPSLLLSTREQDKKLAELKQKIAAKERELTAARNPAHVEFKRWLTSNDRLKVVIHSNAALPLTPALSPEERENVAVRSETSKAPRSDSASGGAAEKDLKPSNVETTRQSTRPLPKGEGWGEGKRDAMVALGPNTIPGLLAHFSFDEIISNKVANFAGTNSAKAHEGPRPVEGKFGNAVELNGENGFTFGKIGHFNRADAFTLSLWLQTPSHAPRFVVAHHSRAPIDAGSRGYELLLEDGKVAFGLHHMWPGNSLKVASVKSLPTNQWVHVAVTYDGSSRARGTKVFINGEAAETEVIRDGLWKDITYGGDEPELTIGYRFRDNGFKGGLVDDFKVFNRALTPLEIAAVAERANLSDVLATALDKLTPAQRQALFEYFFATAHQPVQRLAQELHALRDEQRKFINPIPEIMAMEELPQPKPAYILKRGAYDAHGERVSANTPAVLPPFPTGQPTNRLGLARWLLQPNHPLMARVTVNRLWQMMFGKGLVETSDNLGSQGAQPTHPELLDWLACEFAAPDVESLKSASVEAIEIASQRFNASTLQPWDVKRLLKTIALSATYRQSSQATAELLARDPHNDLLARGPARRLTAEMLRDGALSVSGLLADKIGGPSVKPYQPEGIWDIAMGKPAYNQSKGSDLHRRSLYTYWKRTVPPPTMVLFDAADRSYCTVRRQNTGTPLQSLALLNDIQIVEAARHMSERMFKEGGPTLNERIDWMFRTLTGRKPTAKELPVLKHLFEEQQVLFAAEPASAEKLLNVGEAKNDPKLDKIELAAATVLAQALLNHDQTVMRR